MVQEEYVPLPYYPYDERPQGMELTVEECATALFISRGIIMGAAARLKVSSERLRRRVRQSAKLRGLVRECVERRLDRAEEVLDEALASSDSRRNDWAARYVLNSDNGRGRGWRGVGEGGGMGDRVGERVVVLWGDGRKIAELGPPVVDDSQQRADDIGDRTGAADNIDNQIELAAAGDGHQIEGSAVEVISGSDG